MPAYFYVAYDTWGARQEGRLTVIEESGFWHLMGLWSYQVVSYGTVSSQKSGGGRFYKRAEWPLAFSQMAFMLTSRLPLLEVLKITASQPFCSEVKQTLQDIHAQITHGQTLSQSLGTYPDIFPPEVMVLIQMGEQTSTLNQSLELAAVQGRKRLDTRHLILSKLSYPILLFGIILIVLGLLIGLLAPEMAQFWRSLGKPPPTEIMVVLGVRNLFASTFNFLWHTPSRAWVMLMSPASLGDFFMGVCTCIFIGFCAYLCAYICARCLIALCRMGQRRFSVYPLSFKALKHILRRKKKELPFFKQAAFRRLFIQSMAILLEGRVSLPLCLQTIYKAQSHKVLQGIVKEILEDVTSGTPLGNALKKYKIFEGTNLALLNVGERTNGLVAAFKMMAHIEEAHHQQRMNHLLQLLQPLILLALAGLLLVPIIGVFMPLYTHLIQLESE